MRLLRPLLSLVCLLSLALLPPVIGKAGATRENVPTTQGPDGENPPEVSGFDTYPGKIKWGLDRNWFCQKRSSYVDCWILTPSE